MLRKHNWLILIVLCITISVIGVGTVSAQSGGDFIDTEYDDNVSINTIEAESNAVRLGDVEWDEDGETVTMVIENKGGLTSITMVDQAQIIGASSFTTVPASNYQLSGEETVRVEFSAEKHDDYGQIVTVQTRNEVITLTNEGPGDGGQVDTFGTVTYPLIGGVTLSIFVAVYLYKRLKERDNVSRAF